MRNARFVSGCLTFGLLFAAVPGCGIGPRALRVNQTRYNDAIQRATNEQLLLNLVRLRYRDLPLFLQIPSISTQYEIRQRTDLGATLNENVGVDSINPDAWNLGASFEFSERPTVTLVPLQENEFVRRMFMKYDAETIALLHGSGWAIDRILILTVSRMNTLENAVTASSPTPDEAPEFAEFARVSRLLRELQKRGELTLEPLAKEEDIGDAFAFREVTPEVLLALSEKGYKLRRTEDAYILRQTRIEWHLRVAEAGKSSKEWSEVCQRLGLEPKLADYEVTIKASSSSGEAPDAARNRIIITPRSLLGTLFLLSHAVEVPRAHVVSGRATLTRDVSGNEVDWSDVTLKLLRIHCAANRPVEVAVAVPYRGYWFYIEDSDRNSKSTFMLLSYLFALQAGEYKTRGPLLTLPVGG